MNTVLMNTYRQLPVSFSHGSGCYLYDANGKAYLDALSGIAVTNLGHADPELTQVLQDQAAKLCHISNIVTIPEQINLASSLNRAARMDAAFFCNSGAEANEAAIKLARLYGHQKGIELPSLVVMEGAFHGRTLATISASGNRKVQAGFEPLVQGFVRAPFNDIQVLKSIAKNRREVVAVMVEPIQGEGGAIVPAPQYLREIRKICDEQGWLMILDEVQTGMGRTGYLFAHQIDDAVLPDVMTLAKALGNGFPIGACLARGAAAAVFQPGNHGSTFGGNPLACRVAERVLARMSQPGFLEEVRRKGERLLSGLQNKLAGHPAIVEIRGRGLMVGIELKSPCRELLLEGLEQGILFGVTAEKVVRLLPPLILGDAEIEQLIEKMERVFQKA